MNNKKIHTNTRTLKHEIYFSHGRNILGNIKTQAKKQLKTNNTLKKTMKNYVFNVNLIFIFVKNR